MGESVDGFTAGFPVEAGTDGRDALLAVGMNGHTLPAEHGFPARLIVPGLYGYVSATKWIKEIRLTTFGDEQGFWIPRGWSGLGPIKIQSRIDVPRLGRRPAGRRPGGGRRGVGARTAASAAVEVSVDERHLAAGRRSGPGRLDRHLGAVVVAVGRRRRRARAARSGRSTREGQTQTAERGPAGTRRRHRPPHHRGRRSG